MEQSKALKLIMDEMVDDRYASNQFAKSAELMFDRLLALGSGAGKYAQQDTDVKQDIEKLKEKFAQEGVNIRVAQQRMEDSLLCGPLGKERDGPAELEALLKKADMVSGILGETELRPHVVLGVMLDAPPLMVERAIAAAKKAPPAPDAVETVIGTPPPPDAMETVLQDAGKTIPDAPKPPPVEPSKPPQPVPDPPVEPPKPPPIPPRPTPQPPPVPPKEDVVVNDVWVDQFAPQPVQKPKTGRGKAVGKSILYFALAFFIPLGILLLINMATGGQALYPQTPAARVWMGIYRIVWFAILLGGIKGIVKRGSKMGSVFVGFLIALFVMIMFGRNLVLGIPLLPAPVWLEIIIFIACLIAIGSANLQVSKLTLDLAADDAFSTRSLFIKMSGTLQSMFFRFAIRSFIFPVILVFLVSVFTPEIPEGWKAVFAIYGFWWAFAVLDMALQCNALRVQAKPGSSYNLQKKRKAATLGNLQARMLAVPAFGLFLIWYFGWWPMKTWVIVLYAIYMASWLIVTIVNARRSPAEF